jgi:hypothetical protein
MSLKFNPLTGNLDLVNDAITKGTSDPGSGFVGQLFLNTTTNELKIWYGSQWQTLHTLIAATDSLLLTDDSYLLLTDDTSHLLLAA